MKRVVQDLVFALLVICAIFALNILLQEFYDMRSLIPMTFVLGVFVIAVKTDGYLAGVVASVVSVFAVNYAFTKPYFAFDLISPECIFAAVVMLFIAIMTSYLTTKIKKQEKAKAESEVEKMRANLLRGISHDLRTPLTTIYGSTSAVIENYDALKKEQKLKLLQEIREDSQWLMRMVENLLSVTRIDGENVRVIKTPTVLEELIDAVLGKFRKSYPDCSVCIDIPDEFVSISMDPLLIEQVIINLFENAVIHAKGMTRLSLKVTLEDENAVFEVADDGCGIPKDRLDKLFTGYFEQKNASADSSRSNMGIGLSVCASIIKAHGGKISAENRDGGGAVFRFVLEKED